MAALDQLQNQSWNRRQYDGCKTNDDLRVTTGPGRYQLDVPTSYCDACFVPEPTTRQQYWGASLNGNYIKTDVESDLLNINRPTTKTVCNQYDPRTNQVNKGEAQSTKECSFPQTHSRLVDPPCTNRSVGWNRWEWLCDNPQETVMIPFDNGVTTRLQQRDQYRPCVPKPVAQDALLPAPLSYEEHGLYADMDGNPVQKLVPNMQPAFQNFPRGLDKIPAAPSALMGVAGNNVTPPSLAMDPMDVYSGFPA